MKKKAPLPDLPEVRKEAARAFAETQRLLT